jgi:hypothetical protein
MFPKVKYKGKGRLFESGSRVISYFVETSRPWRRPEEVDPKDNNVYRRRTLTIEWEGSRSRRGRPGHERICRSITQHPPTSSFAAALRPHFSQGEPR